MNDVLSFLKQQNVPLTTQQVGLFEQMNLTLIDLRNINISTSEFTEFCQELQLSIGPKLKLKSAIIKLQSRHNQPLTTSHNITYDTNNEAKTDDINLQTLISMGFTALKANKQDIIKAIETLTTTTNIPSSSEDSKSQSILISSSIITPIGSIIAWYKHFGEQELVLPNDAWIECNGQTIDDRQSIFNGQTMPNLNGESRFLRGGTESGVIEEDQLKKHSHSGNFQIKGGNVENVCWNLGARSTWASGPVSETGGDETRPKNMSVIWIMRIK